MCEKVQSQRVRLVVHWRRAVHVSTQRRGGWRSKRSACIPLSSCASMVRPCLRLAHCFHLAHYILHALLSRLHPLKRRILRCNADMRELSSLQQQLTRALRPPPEPSAPARPRVVPPLKALPPLPSAHSAPSADENLPFRTQPSPFPGALQRLPAPYPRLRPDSRSSSSLAVGGAPVEPLQQRDGNCSPDRCQVGPFERNETCMVDRSGGERDCSLGHLVSQSAVAPAGSIAAIAGLRGVRIPDRPSPKRVFNALDAAYAAAQHNLGADRAPAL